MKLLIQRIIFIWFKIVFQIFFLHKTTQLLNLSFFEKWTNAQLFLAYGSELLVSGHRFGHHPKESAKFSRGSQTTIQTDRQEIFCNGRVGNKRKREWPIQIGIELLAGRCLAHDLPPTPTNFIIFYIRSPKTTQLLALNLWSLASKI